MRFAISTDAVALLGVTLSHAPLSAQDDVVQAGIRHGTVPPESYFRARRADPGAYRFSRAWMNRNPRLRVEPGDGARPRIQVRSEDPLSPTARSTSEPLPVLGQRETAVTGTFTYPVVLGYFADGSGPRFDRETVQVQFFDGPNDRGGTIRDFYAEVSGGAVELRGETQPWVRSSLTQAEVTAGVSGLGGSNQVGGFILSILDAVDDGTVDWGRYDNDGPDGVPNSGDDDGFVDVLAVVHPTPGAECSGASNRIWSHRWTVWSLTGSPYETRSTAADGGVIRINDYTIQPLLNCAGDEINDIGVFAHELGHGFGLPDLYCTLNDCSSAGIGEWGLMGSGSWGCDGDDAAYPCHMSGWSKAMLGWVEVEDLPEGMPLSDYLLEPVTATGRILRYAIPGTREYYLLENRQALGFDRNLHAPGLLVWHVDQDRVDQGWPVNRINADPGRYGVSVIQADNQGRLQASSGNRGDAGDPFPGTSGRSAFHAGSIPAAVSHDGLVSGLTLVGLEPAGLDLAFQLATGLQSVTLSTAGDSGAESLLTVDGTALAAGGEMVVGAPFQRLDLQAAPGELVEAGVRTPFLSWDDGFTEPGRVLEVGFQDTALVASYGGRQVQVSMTLEGGRFGVEPATILSEPASPGLWFQEGTAVTLKAQPTTGFSFLQWTGPLEGAPNPVGLVVESPLSAGAVFGFDFAVNEPAPMTVAAGDQVSVGLEAENATAPVRWYLEEGTLPAGMVVLEYGRLAGTPAEPGLFTFTLRARDALGLEGSAVVALEVGVPDLPLSVLGGALLQNGSEPTAGQVLYLDLSGNRNGRLDTGDIRSHLMRAANGTVPPAAGVVDRSLILTRVGPGAVR
jgi:M6 family metalloprotease-like protein